MHCHNCTCHQCIIEPSLGLSSFMIVIIASLHRHYNCHRCLKEKHGSGAVVALIGLSPWFQPLSWLEKDLRLLNKMKTTIQSNQNGLWIYLSDNSFDQTNWSEWSGWSRWSWQSEMLSNKTKGKLYKSLSDKRGGGSLDILHQRVKKNCDKIPSKIILERLRKLFKDGCKTSSQYQSLIRY